MATEWLGKLNLDPEKLKTTILTAAKSAAKDRRLRVAGGVVAGLVLIMLLLPLFVDANKFVPEIQSQLSTALGRQVTLGKLSLNLFEGGLVADDLSIADDPAYSSQPFLQAKSLKVGVELMPLLFSKQLHVTKFEVVQPSIALIENAQGRWNFSTIGSGGPPAQTTSAAAAPEMASSTPASGAAVPSLRVDKLDVDDATLRVQTLPAGAVHVYDKVDIAMKDFSFTSPFTFTMTAELPAGGKLSLSGAAGPIPASDNTRTPMDASLTLTHLEPVGAGFLSAQGGVDGVLDVSAHLKSDGNVATLDGTVTGNKMKFAAKGTPTSQTVTVDFSTALTLATQAGEVTRGEVHAGSVAATVGGTYLLAPTGTTLHMTVNAPGMSVDALQSLLPALGVSLPSGSGLKGGTLSASLKIDGPVNQLVIAGPVDLRDSRLQGFSLASKLGSLPTMNKTGGDTGGTEIKLLHADIVMTPAELQTKSIDAEVPALGSATGDGVIYPDNTLDYKMNAKLVGLGQLVGGISELIGGKKSTNAGGIPLIIKGTTQNPSFRLDTSAMGLGKPSGAVNGTAKGTAGKLKGLFGK